MSASDRPQEVADIVDGLGDTPTPDEVYHAVQKYDNDYVAAAAYAQAKGGGGGGGAQSVQTATVTLSVPEILAMNSSPIEAVAAPGANKFLLPLGMASWITFATTPYTSITGTIDLTFGGGFGGFEVSNSNVLTASSDHFGFEGSTNVDDGGSPSELLNKPLIIWNRVSDPEDGDSTIKVCVLYAVLDFA